MDEAVKGTEVATEATQVEPVKMPIDRKYAFYALNRKTHKSYDDTDGVVFLAKDNAFPATLRFYRAECERQGADEAQLKGIDLLIERVDAYRASNAHLCKVPDVTPAEAEELLRPNT